MILISPAGILPTLNEYGGRWALLFKIPEFKIILVQKIILPFIYLFISNKEFKHSIKLCMNPNYCGDLYVSSKISVLGLEYVYWNDPQIEHLNVPCLIIHGKEDNLIPYYQALLLETLGHPVLLLENTNHSPINKNKNKIAQYIIKHLNKQIDIKQIKLGINALLFASNIYNINYTKLVIFLLYSHIWLVNRKTSLH